MSTNQVATVASPAGMEGWLTAADVRQALRADMDRRAMTITEWAARFGFSPRFVGSVLAGDKQPSERICDALGIERREIVAYVRKAKG